MVNGYEVQIGAVAATGNGQHQCPGVAETEMYDGRQMERQGMQKLAESGVAAMLNGKTDSCP